MIKQTYRCGSRFYAVFTAASFVVLAGCHDVEYNYNIPEGDADCPSGMTYRSSGTGIVDRSSGSGIVDRDGDPVGKYCYVDNCAGTWDDSVAASIDWHQEDHEVVVAKRRCLASLTGGGGGTPIANPPITGGSGTTTNTDQQDDPPDDESPRE